MADVFKQSGDLGEYFDKSYGYAAFPKVGKFAFIVGIGGAGGDVYIRSKDGKGEMVKVGTSKMGMASGGWSLGLTVYSEIIFFENKEAFDSFASGNFEFQAGVSELIPRYFKKQACGSFIFDGMHKSHFLILKRLHNFLLMCQRQAKVHVLNTGAESAARTTGSSETTGASMANKGTGYTNGMATFILPKAGAMIDVSAEGQKFTYRALTA